MFLRENKSCSSGKNAQECHHCAYNVLVRVPPRKEGEQIGIYIWGGRGGETDLYFKELAHAVVGASKSEICKARQQAGTQEDVM